MRRPSGRLFSLAATDIKVFTAFAQNRIPARTAHTLAYIAQLMLFSLPSFKKEFTFRYKFAQWDNMLTNAVRFSAPPPDPATLACENSEDFSRADETEVVPPSSTPKES